MIETLFSTLAWHPFYLGSGSRRQMSYAPAIIRSMGEAEAWVPLPGNEPVESGALYEGVPDWLDGSFWEWVRAAFHDGSGLEAFALDTALLGRYERVCRIAVGYEGRSVVQGIRSLRTVVRRDEREIQLADFLLAEGKDPATLDIALHEAGSVWKVGTRAGRPGLERRVLDGVQEAADDIMTGSGRAGQRLSEAWTALYGATPDPSKAYSLAVKAVEDAAVPLVSPKDLTATLGKIIGQISGPSKWSVPVVRENPSGMALETIVSMMKTLWNGQADRHGGHADPSLTITQDAAEVAVTLAVALVQLFSASLVQPVVKR